MIYPFIKKIISSLLYKRYYNKISTDELCISREELQKTYPTHFYETESVLSFDTNNYTISPNSNLPKWLSKLQTKQHYSGASFSIIENAFLVGDHATAIKNGKIVLETFSGNKTYLIRKGDRRRLRFHRYYRATCNLEYAFSFVNCVNYSYFHWVAEALPLLEAVFEFEKKYPEKEKPLIIVNAPTPSFIYQYLTLAGIEKERIISWKWKKIKINNLILPTLRYIRPSGTAYNYYSKTGFDFLRKTYWNLSKNSSVDLLEKVYITRNDADNRKVLNEDKLIPVLEKHGYKTITLSDYSVIEQIQLFSTVKALITPHGAGLTNLIYGNSIKVIELFPENRNLDLPYYFYQLACYFQHLYTLVLCKADSEENIQVNVLDIEELIRDNENTFPRSLEK